MKAVKSVVTMPMPRTPSREEGMAGVEEASDEGGADAGVPAGAAPGSYTNTTSALSASIDGSAVAGLAAAAFLLAACASQPPRPPLTAMSR